MGRGIGKIGLPAAACLSAAVLLVSSGCSGGLLDWVRERAGVSSGTVLSGRLVDSVTGAPVPGCTIAMGTGTATSGPDGAFTLTTAGPVSGPFSVRGANRQFSYVTPVWLGGDTQVTILVAPVSASGYPAHTLNGRIYAGAEIPVSTPVTFSVLNSSGGQSSSITCTYGASGYSFTTPTWGNDCLVMAYVQASTPFTVIVNKVDFSSPSTTLDLAQPGALPVSVTASAVGNFGQLVFTTPYGLLVYGMGMYQMTSIPCTVSGTNPYGYSGMWMQVSVSIGGFIKQRVSYSDFLPIGPAVTLPAINAALGPSAGPVPASIAYSSSSGVLSIPVVAGAKIYQFFLNDAASGDPLGLVMSDTASVTLPAWMQSQLAGRSVSVSVTPTDWSLTTTDVATLVQGMNAMGAVPGLQMAQTQSATGNSKTLTF